MAGDNEGDLFRQEMAKLKVTPHKKSRRKIRADTKTKPRTKPKVVTKTPRAKPATAPQKSAASGVMMDKTEQGDFVEFARGGVQKRTFNRLKRGDYECTDTLDLHGHTAAEAKTRLTNFLSTTGNATVLIIHGKGLHSPGTGVIKRFTVNFLKLHPTVRAFCSAQPKDGGTGAVYVLLSRARR